MHGLTPLHVIDIAFYSFLVGNVWEDFDWDCVRHLNKKDIEIFQWVKKYTIKELNLKMVCP